MKLHEVLAAESVASGQADKCRTDLAITFDKKRHLFGEKVVVFRPNAEGEQERIEEQSSLQSTVPTELAWIGGIWAKALDLAYWVDLGNTTARADIVLSDATLIAKDVPATALLQLEKRAAEIHALVSAIPTLDPTKGFAPDPDRGKGVYRSRETRKERTKKDQQPIVLYPATPEHPAQTQLITRDVVTGSIVEREWSGLITPAQKATLIERAEELRQSIKKARARANDVVVPEQKIGGAMLDYVFGALASERV